MRPRRALSQQDTTTVFDEAVRERALAMLTLQAGDDWQSFKSRFLERDSNHQFFVLDYQAVNAAPLPHLAPGQCVGISFRSRSRKILFATAVQAKGHFLLDDRTSIPAVRYCWPDNLTELQRRSYYRTPIPAGMSLLATMWPGGTTARNAAQASTMQLVTGSLADISCGGALVLLNDLGAPSWPEEVTLGVELQLDDSKPPLRLDARYRGVRHAETGQLSAALQFIGLELSVDGRLVLEQLADCVQRLHRLNIASGASNWNRRRGE